MSQPETTRSPLREILGFDIDEKIEAAQARGRLYTPTRSEWDRAKPYQRRHMTWPEDVLRAIARERL